MFLECLLIIASFIITVVVLFGDTWKSQNTGINKLNLKGKIAFVFAFAIMCATLYNKYNDELKKDILKINAYERVAIHAWEIELQIEKIEQMNLDENKLSYLKQKFQLLSSQLSRILETSTNLLEADEIKKIQSLILFIENETLKLNTQVLNTEIQTSLSDLTFNSRKLRKELCKKIINDSYFCYEREIVSGVYFWDSKNDVKMNIAINKARESFIDILKNIKRIKTDELYIKAPLPLNDGTSEDIWLKNISYKEGFITGTIDNIVTGISFGQKGDKFSIKPELITDWRISKNGDEFGNFTLYVLLDRLSEEERNDFLSKLKFTLPREPKIYNFE